MPKPWSIIDNFLAEMFHIPSLSGRPTKLIKTLSQKRNAFLFFEHTKQTFDGRFRFQLLLLPNKQNVTSNSYHLIFYKL